MYISIENLLTYIFWLLFILTCFGIIESTPYILRLLFFYFRAEDDIKYLKKELWEKSKRLRLFGLGMLICGLWLKSYIFLVN